MSERGGLRVKQNDDKKKRNLSLSSLSARSFSLPLRDADADVKRSALVHGSFGSLFLLSNSN